MLYPGSALGGRPGRGKSYGSSPRGGFQQPSPDHRGRDRRTWLEVGSSPGPPLFLLRSCGYLAERSGERVVLSDNAHRYDFHDLAEWLPFGPEALETFPWVREFSRHGLEGSGFETGSGAIPQASPRVQDPRIIPRWSGGLSRQGPVCCWRPHKLVLRRPRRLSGSRTGDGMRQQRVDRDPDPLYRNEVEARPDLEGGKRVAVRPWPRRRATGCGITWKSSKWPTRYTESESACARSGERSSGRWMNGPRSGLTRASCREWSRCSGTRHFQRTSECGNLGVTASSHDRSARLLSESGPLIRQSRWRPSVATTPTSPGLPLAQRRLDRLSGLRSLFAAERLPTCTL